MYDGTMLLTLLLGSLASSEAQAGAHEGLEDTVAGARNWGTTGL